MFFLGKQEEMRWILFGIFAGLFFGGLQRSVNVKECRRKVEKLKYTDFRLALSYLDSLRATGEWERERIGFRLDMMQMEVYVSGGWSQLAVMCGEKLLQQDSVQRSDPYFFEVANSLVGECLTLGQYEKALKYAGFLLERGERVGDEWSIASAYFTVAQVKWRMNERGKVREWAARALGILEHRKRSGSIMLLSYVYGELISYAIEEEDYREALRIGKRREELIGLMEGYGGREAYIDQQKGFLFIKMAYAYRALGKTEEARAYFRRFRSTRFAASAQGVDYMVPYLRLCGKMRQLTGILEKREEEIVRNKLDSVSWEMIGCMDNLALAYAALEDYRKAYIYASRKALLADSLNERMRRHSLMELNVMYDVKEGEIRLREQERVMEKRRFYIEMLSAGIGILLLCLLGIGFHMYRIRQKNRKLMEQMRDSVRPLVCNEEENPDQTERLFRRFESLIQDERLFLSPGLGRDEVVARLFTNKNRLSLAIRSYTQGSFTDYINGLRLDYALELLADERNYTMEMIAGKAGFGTVRSFYRIFKEKYSVSPSMYKRFLKKN